MSDKQHTPEQWISEGSFIGIPNGKGTFYMVPLSGINQDSREANARRIVACVNACAGIETHVLEDHNRPDGLALVLEFQKAVVQRDELLEALERMVQIARLTIGWSCTPANADGPLVAAERLIASVKGGSA